MITLEQIKELPPELLALQNTQAIADALPDEVTLVSTEIGKGKIIETIGMDAANAILDIIDTEQPFRHVKQLLANGWLDVNSAVLREQLDQMAVAGAISVENVAKIKALAERRSRPDEFEVRKLCWSDDGQWLV